MSYTNIFGGYTINTAFPSYVSYSLLDGQVLRLNWASSFVDSPSGTNNITAQINDLSSETNANEVILGDATLISVGQTIQFNNIGSNLINVYNFTDGLLATLPPTNANQIILYLQDNTTQSGTWGITTLGAGTSSIDASVLAGPGTIALPSGPSAQINTNFLGKTIDGAYQVVITDRAQIIVWTGGTADITLVPVANLPNEGGFYIAVNNEGTGVVTIVTSDGSTIDGNNSFSLNPGQSSYFINVVGGAGSNWNTLGYGTATYFQVQTLNLNLTPYSGSFINLTPAQAAPLVQTYTGALTGNVTVFYPAVAGQWYIFNSTSNAFTVTVQLGDNVTPVGNPIVIPQGSRVIIYSDGTTVYNTPTIVTGATFSDGSVGAPGINFLSDPTTGFYKIPPNPAGVVAYSSAGTESLVFGGATSGIAFSIMEGLPGVYWNAANTFYEGFQANPLLASNLIFTLPPTAPTINGQLLLGSMAGDLSFSPYTINFPFNTSGVFYASAPTTIRTLATANNGVLITSNIGIPSIGNTLPFVVQNNITSVGTIISGVWNGSVIGIAQGGTGRFSFTPNSLLCAGLNPTAFFQEIPPSPNAGYVLTATGGNTIPVWAPPSGGGGPIAASPSQMAAATSTAVYTSPRYQVFHPSSAKYWANFDAASGALFNAYNISSVNVLSTGSYRINFSLPSTSPNYAVSITLGSLTSAIGFVNYTISPTVNNIHILVRNPNGIPTTTDVINVIIFGNA